MGTGGGERSIPDNISLPRHSCVRDHFFPNFSLQARMLRYETSWLSKAPLFASRNPD